MRKLEMFVAFFWILGGWRRGLGIEDGWSFNQDLELECRTKSEKGLVLRPILCIR